MPFNFQNARTLLDEFRLNDLFIEELGWSQPSNLRSEDLEVDEQVFQRTRIAEMSNVPIFEIVAADGEIPNADARLAVYKAIAAQFTENLLIFLNGDRTRSLWYWAKREGTKLYPRTVSFVQGEPTDLILSRIGGLYFSEEELKNGYPSVVIIANRLQKSLDVETVTNEFYKKYQLLHLEFVTQYIEGIDHESDRRWYASVILNRLMFVYFLQSKAFIGNDIYNFSQQLEYLQLKLEESKQRGRDRFFSEFLQTLFFEGFAESIRPDPVRALLGQVPYLNGGLFLKHRIEIDYPNIAIADAAFEKVFALFSAYNWNLDDRPDGKANEINPDVLGYIFEKYINQKAFGAYYTRPQITEYLCDRTINKLILDRVNQVSDRQFETIGDLLVKLDARLCRHLIYGDNAILKTLSLLDPACGSGAFLIAAMKTLMPIYSSVIGTIKNSSDYQLTNWLNDVERNHPSLPYFIKKRIITDNLYGVDIMPEASEIAKLRLFLALVSSARTADDLEPLPNIDFNIMAGNSLIGLIRVDENSFDQVKLTQKAKARGLKQDDTEQQLSEVDP
ncbi:hypothetical protein H6F67_00105 [Microcoleus sp. FACHB-1515]|uniref:DNA methyltransferase n=1 Tax=Cyanophyceae TaxID=3028117 RepID=UPI001689BCDC|nr:DNA methyltransferase [Microcoleus sp. FACHB-1515]MBD2088277.1 hypothetical protein [Microcoleus sp. FACHB-1515]